MKTTIWVLVTLLVAGGAYAALRGLPADRDGNDPRGDREFTWRVEDAPDHEDTMPRQTVFLETGGRTYRAGESMGCNIRLDDLEANEITRQTCWFAGGGDEYGVFREGGAHVLKRRWVQETGGLEIDAEPEGPWEVVTRID